MSLSLSVGAVRPSAGPVAARPSGRHGSGRVLRGGETTYAARHATAPHALRGLGWLRRLARA